MSVDVAVASRFLERAEASGLVDVAVTTMDSPIGTLLLMATRRGLVRIAFDSENRDEVLGEVAAQLSPRILEAPRRLDTVRRELDGYFTGGLRDFGLGLGWVRVGGELPGCRRRGGHAERRPSSWQRAGFEPDPHCGALPSRRPHRRSPGRLRRRTPAQALAAGPRDGLNAGYQPGGGSLRLSRRTKSSARATASQRREKKSCVIIRLSASEVTVTAHWLRARETSTSWVPPSLRITTPLAAGRRPRSLRREDAIAIVNTSIPSARQPPVRPNHCPPNGYLKARGCA